MEKPDEPYMFNHHHTNDGAFCVYSGETVPPGYDDWACGNGCRSSRVVNEPAETVILPPHERHDCVHIESLRDRVIAFLSIKMSLCERENVEGVSASV